MRLTKKRLRKIMLEIASASLLELHASNEIDEEYELLQDLGDMYSDMHKELYGRRPKIPMFKTVEEANAAVEEIWAEYAAYNRSREEQERQELEYMEMERRMRELMPGEYDIELPMHSGMGRRTEGIMKITKRQLRRIIKEEKSKLLKEVNHGPNYDPLVELYDIDQHLSDAVMKLQEVANFLEASDGRRALQFDGIRGKVEGAKRSVESHIQALEGKPA